MKNSKYVGKTIKTETKEFTIVRESATCIFVHPENCYKDIAISKSKLIEVENSLYLEFNSVITHTDFQLNALGFSNAKQRKADFLNSVNHHTLPKTSYTLIIK